jgi:potassium efflux system protein
MTRPLAAAEEEIGEVLRPTLVTSEILKSKIAETEAAPDLPDETKTKLVELYRKALSNLEQAEAHADRAGAFQQATQTAPAQTQLIHEQIEAAKGADQLATLGVSLESPLEQLEQQLQKEQADLAAVAARLADFKRRLAAEENRPSAIRQRLVEATQQQGEIAATLRVPPNTGEKPALIQARRWVLENSNEALSAEIKMLDQELLSQPMRLDLLKAKQDQAATSVASIDARVKVLSELVNRKRQHEAEQAKIDAEKTQRETAGLAPLLIRLADRNTELTDDLNTMAVRLDELHREQTQAKKLVERIAADHNEAQTTLEITGLTEGLGQMLLEARESLPDLQVYARSARALKQEIAAAVVQRLRHRKEARRIGDPDQALASLETQLTVDKTPELSDRLHDLVEKRQILLRKALATDEFYLNRLRELNAAEHRLLDAARAYDDFLNEHLLWLGSADPTRLQDLLNLPDEARRLVSPAIWSGLARVFIDQIVQSPAAWLALLLTAALLWRRRALFAAIEETSTRLGKPTTDRFSYSLRALVLTLITAAPLPLLLAVPGWQFQVAAQGTDLSQALGVSLLHVALLLYYLRVLRIMCIPRGLAAAHFHWPESNLRLLRVELDRLTWIFVPAMLVVRLVLDMNPAETGGTIARLVYIGGFGALALFFYRVFHPKGGVLAYLRLRRETGVLVRTNKLWFPLLLAYPLGLAVLAQTGYLYSATALSRMFLYTLLMIFGLVVLRALALRWLLVARRRLAYEAAMERRQAALAAKQAGKLEAGDEEGSALQVEEPEVDLEALSDDSRELVTLAVIFTGLVGLYLIWSPVLPALRIFDDVALWYHTVTLDGEDKRLPITLADLGLALIYAIGTGVLAKRLPAVLEIILLQRFDMSSGSRYTVTTLTNYAIIAVGILLVLNTIGAQWSQLQWLVAALGVGIGFGLQEIVANFISGLIILFERPIRVGDLVTVGNTDGFVTRIQIRATTIRDWDNKELLVPNKEFITGRLLNWSLSDQVTRIVITVGVAYGSDVDKAHELMLEAAREHQRVLDDPAPSVTFTSFGDNSLVLSLRVFVDAIDYRIPTMTELHKAINRKFNEAGIVIAFPQRDLHLDTSEPLRVSIEDVRQEKSDSGNRG